ncbi:NTP transferase domain-containing protein [Candidatus Babeliales bacterium]|nr:NTP transferase domain-containing protein [Candidatus Babeliales bacterium]
MLIIIPMSGVGNRFMQAGYSDPKPLINVDGKPIIEHVVNLFPGEHNFIFICNQEHLQTTEMYNVLRRIAPSGTIVSIPKHKNGPVYAVSKVFNLIDNDEEVIVNYCDFSMYWDYNNFLHHTRTRNADGAIPAYKGFHPHMLHDPNYAFIKDQNQWLLEIKEKAPFTTNKTNEYASTGAYYFKRGSLLKKYFPELIERDINVNGEYYVSLIYNLLKRDGLNVSVYEVQHMLQWGTPEDLEEYVGWSAYFKRAAEQVEQKKITHDLMLIPLAGRGQRFVQDGYADPKPLIPVSGKPMIVQAAASLPATTEQIFVCLNEHCQRYPLEHAIKETYPHAEIKKLDHVTEGQACTCEFGLQNIDPEKSLVIGACDNGMLWNQQKYQDLVDDKSVDVIAWSFRNHPSSNKNPQMYGWLAVDHNNVVTNVSVKVPLSANPSHDHAIVGTFTFKKAAYFLQAAQNLRAKNIRVNNEFYVDSCINQALAMGLTVKVFEVDHYVCWGTPNDLRTFEYWQSFFHKCTWHPYRLEKDATVAPEKIAELDMKYRMFTQPNREPLVTGKQQQVSQAL